MRRCTGAAGSAGDDPGERQFLQLSCTYQRLNQYTITLSLTRGAVPDRDVEQVLTDLTRRIGPNVSPQPPPVHAAGRR